MIQIAHIFALSRVGFVPPHVDAVFAGYPRAAERRRT
jgi:hypothetical protein